MTSNQEDIQQSKSLKKSKKLVILFVNIFLMNSTINHNSFFSMFNFIKNSVFAHSQFPKIRIFKGFAKARMLFQHPHFFIYSIYQRIIKFLQTNPIMPRLHQFIIHRIRRRKQNNMSCPTNSKKINKQTKKILKSSENN